MTKHGKILKKYDLHYSEFFKHHSYTQKCMLIPMQKFVLIVVNIQ